MGEEMTTRIHFCHPTNNNFDHRTGPNHVLPTGSSARYTGGLSVLNFLRVKKKNNCNNISYTLYFK